MDIRLSETFQGHNGEMDFAIVLAAFEGKFVVARVTGHSLKFNEWYHSEYFPDPIDAARRWADRVATHRESHHHGPVDFSIDAARKVA